MNINQDESEVTGEELKDSETSDAKYTIDLLMSILGGAVAFIVQFSILAFLRDVLYDFEPSSATSLKDIFGNEFFPMLMFGGICGWVIWEAKKKQIEKAGDSIQIPAFGYGIIGGILSAGFLFGFELLLAIYNRYF